MNQQNELQSILERMDKYSRKQLLHARLQTVFSIVCALFCGILLLKLLQFIPQLESLVAQAEVLLRDLNAVTKELAKLDLSLMVENINDLVTTSQSGVEEALAQLTAQVDALLRSIRDFRTYMVIYHYYVLGHTDEQVAHAISVSRVRALQLRQRYLDAA